MKKIGWVIVGMALSAGTQAATLSYDFTSDQALTDFTFDGRLGLFDSALGTLTGVTLEVYGEFTTALAIGNTSTNARGTVRALYDFSMLFSSSLAPLNELLTETQMEWQKDTGKQQLEPSQTMSWADTESHAGFIDVSSLLSSFAVAGGGDFDLSCTSNTSTMVAMGGNGWFSQTTLGACSATVTYTYDEAPLYTLPIEGGFSGGPMPVPEPPSLAVLGLGLAYMAARGRARKAGAA
ncbi:choice-of-anchor E domain-containing protein [uncultured Azohydromonas sp.]|uniref:choice-of-anchor E domain-containing protein n=1 Tax=uncultured Azohydromonas sp. TaxID=487342 RepID=UPI00262D69EC|nr:choice-of-anchor E domain-containing protein [uncultured Azohydromonas sp.]